MIGERHRRALRADVEKKREVEDFATPKSYWLRYVLTQETRDRDMRFIKTNCVELASVLLLIKIERLCPVRRKE